jgi:hypothetical protein
VRLFTSFLEVSSSSNFLLEGVGSISVSSVSGSNISGLFGLEGLLSINKLSGGSFFWDESGIRRTEWVGGLSVHGVKLGVGNSLEWGGSSVHHVDFGSSIVPFLGVGGGNIIGVVLGDHSVVLFLESLLLGDSGS